MTSSRQFPRAGSQRGAALIIALVLLALLSLLSVSAMQTATMQERMAGSARDRQLAFQAAEAALRAGEDWLPGNLAGLDTANPLNDPALWDGSDSSGGIDLDTSQLSAQPVFHVGPPERVRVGVGLPPQFRTVYRVTARAQGGSPSTVAVLQSTIEP